MKNAPFLFYPPDWFGFFEEIGWKEKETGYAGLISLEFQRFPPFTEQQKREIEAMSEEEKQASLRMNGYTLLERA